MTNDISKRKAGVWDCTLTEEQRWKIYERARQFGPDLVIPWIAQEFSVPAPTRSSYYRFLAFMRSQESAHRIEQAITEKAAIGKELDAIGDISPDLKEAFAQDALAARIRGDVGAAGKSLKLALAIGKAQLAKADHDLKVKAEARAAEDLTLRMKEFEHKVRSDAEKAMNAFLEEIKGDAKAEALVMQLRDRVMEKIGRTA